MTNFTPFISTARPCRGFYSFLGNASDLVRKAVSRHFTHSCIHKSQQQLQLPYMCGEKSYARNAQTITRAYHEYRKIYCITSRSSRLVNRKIVRGYALHNRNVGLIRSNQNSYMNSLRARTYNYVPTPTFHHMRAQVGNSTSLYRMPTVVHYSTPHKSLFQQSGHPHIVRPIDVLRFPLLFQHRCTYHNICTNGAVLRKRRLNFLTLSTKRCVQYTTGKKANTAPLGNADTLIQNGEDITDGSANTKSVQVKRQDNSHVDAQKSIKQQSGRRYKLLNGPYKGRSGVDTVFQELVKGYVPEVRHSEAKHKQRAANAIRRKSPPYYGSYGFVNGEGVVTVGVEDVYGIDEKTVKELERERAGIKTHRHRGILDSVGAVKDSDFDDVDDDELSATPPVPMKKLFELLTPEIGRMSVAMGAVLVSSLASLAFPSAVGQVVDSVVTAGDGGFESAQNIILAMIGVVGMGSTAVVVRVSQLNIVSERVARELRKNVFQCMIHQRMRFFDENDTGRLVNRLSTDTAMVASTLTDNVARCIKAGTAVVTSTGFLINISPELTGITMTVLPVFGVAAYGYGEYRKKLAQALLTRYARENQVSMEHLQGIRTVHSFTAEDTEIERYRNTVNKSFGLAKKVGYAEGLFLGGGFAIAQCTLLGVLYYGGSLMLADVITVGKLTSFCMYTGYLFVSVGQVSVAVSEFLKAQGAARRVFGVINTSTLNSLSPIERDTEELIKPQTFMPDIQFKNVSFSYPTRPGLQVLKNVNITLSAGHTLAICGSSGSGKSTLGLLLGKYYDVEDGSIEIGGYDVKTLSTRWLRENIAEVTQMPLLFSGSVRDNIAYGTQNATDEEIYSAAKTANAHDFISRLPNGYDTQCGERGKALSGGQMQRVCIARAVLKDAKVYVMDEATSALDAESEHLVVEALEKVMQNKTAIVFTHHLKVIQAADVVAVMDSGTIVQVGKYDDLIQESGPLQRIANTLQ